MKAFIRLFTGSLALLLVPLALYVATMHFGPTKDSVLAFWGPLFVLALDAGLVFLFLGQLSGKWRLPWPDRLGIAIVLPLLLAMGSWALLVETVSEQRNSACCVTEPGTLPAAP